VEVIDTGIGIRSKYLPGLFQPFYQGDPAVAEKYGGSGLGLAIARHIAEQLGGELTVKSMWGQGSTFTLTVPTGDLSDVRMLHNPSEAMQAITGGTCESAAETLNGVRILLAEDGFDNRQLIETILRCAGAEVVSVENGRMAVAKAQRGGFDLILMDMNMPEMDGYEATRLLRDRGYRQPILALTANIMDGDSERCLRAGCNEYLSKPVDRARLIQTILNYAQRQPAPEPAVPNDIPSPPSLDEPIISQYVGDMEMAEILKEFVGRLPDQLAAMRRSLAEERYEELRRLAHMLKGAGGSYGYPELTDASKPLEDAAKRSDHAAAEAALEALARLIQAIQTGFARSSTEKIAPL